LKQDDSHQCHVAGKVAGAFFGGLFTGLFILLGGLWIYSRTHKSDKQMFSIFLQPFVDHHLATDNRTVENVHEAAKVDEG
jgi:ABC-type Na+ efflux pump permease subunit